MDMIRLQRHPSGRPGFTLIEIMIAIMILAVGISAAIGAIINNNDYRKTLDESALADLVLRQMASRLKTTSISLLGQVYATPTNQAQGWTLHLRATPSSPSASPAVPMAVTSAAALSQPYSTPTAYAPPFRPLIQQDLIDAGILREQVGLMDLNVYVEYYNLNTVTGLQNVGGMLVPSESGLVKRYNELQDANPTGSPLQMWWSVVGDPDESHRSPAALLPPSDTQAEDIIMPATFSVANVDQPGTSEQVRGAFNHGLVVRILVSWRPGVLMSPTATRRSWRETVIVKRD